MQVELNQNEDGVILKISGVVRKQDAMQLADQINALSRKRPKRLALDCSQLITISLDSAPFIFSALERLRIGKQNLCAFSCNENVKKTLRGAGFERIGDITPP